MSLRTSIGLSLLGSTLEAENLPGVRCERAKNGNQAALSGI